MPPGAALCFYSPCVDGIPPHELPNLRIPTHITHPNMKTKTTLLLSALALALTLPLTFTNAADEKKPDAAAAKVEAGPRKGRILAVGEPKAEFFVEADKTISIMFYDKENKVVAPAAQSATATVDAKGKKTKLEFAKKGDALVSSAKIPDGDANPIVVQVKTAADAKPQNFRFKLDLSKCGGCPNPEYACTCDE